MKYLILPILAILAGCTETEKKYIDKGQVIDRYVFITSESYTLSEIGGFWGASDICESHANLNPDLAGKRFIAYIGTDENIADIIERLPGETNDLFMFRTPDGAAIYSGKAFELSSRIGNLAKDEHGNSITVNGVYTHTTWNGYNLPTGGCDGFTSEVGTVSIGNPYGIYKANDFTDQCSLADYHFYCIQQGD